VPRTGMRLSEYLQRTAEGTTQCTWCGAEVAPANVDWKDRAVLRRLPVERAGPYRTASGEFFLLEACCPGCGTLLDTELVAGDDPHLHDRVHRWPEPDA
jgi:N-methylhydantoinase B